MANIKLGLFITDIKGSVGGHTLQKSKQSLILRSKPRQKKADSSNQSAVKSAVATTSIAFRALSSANRALWQVYAKSTTFLNSFGDVYSPTARNIFMKQNFNLAMCSLPLISVPPPPPSFPPISVTSITFRVVTSQMLFRKDPGISSNRWIVSISRPVKYQRNSPSRGPKFTKYEPIYVGNTENYFSQYSALFGTPIGDAYYYVTFTELNGLTGHTRPIFIGWKYMRK